MDDIVDRMAEWWEYDPGQIIPQARAEIARLRESATFWESCAALNEKKIEALEAQLAEADALAEAAGELSLSKYGLKACRVRTALAFAIARYRAAREADT